MGKNRRVPRKAFTTFGWVSKTIIALELSEIQPFSLNLNSAKCNLDEIRTQAVFVSAENVFPRK